MPTTKRIQIASTYILEDGISLNFQSPVTFSGTVSILGIPTFASPSTFTDVTATGVLISSGSLSIKSSYSTPVVISALNIDGSLGNNFKKTLAANSTFTFTNFTDGQTIIVALTNVTPFYTAGWTGPVWSGGTVPTLTAAAKTDVYTFRKIGSVIYGDVKQNY